MLRSEGQSDFESQSIVSRDYPNLYLRGSAGVLGATAGILIWIWPQHAFLLQEALYSSLVLGLVLFAVWSERQKPNYWKAWVAIAVMHGIILWLTKPLFPFHSIWGVAVIAVIECAALALAFYKVVGE